MFKHQRKDERQKQGYETLPAYPYIIVVTQYFLIVNVLCGSGGHSLFIQKISSIFITVSKFPLDLYVMHSSQCQEVIAMQVFSAELSCPVSVAHPFP